MDVSIIIVNYNTKELTKNCLTSIYEHTCDIDFEVIVSDNGSTDGSIEMIRTEFPQIVLIENKTNLGFGAANNRGLKKAKGKYIFYLNSDTVLLNNAVKMFFDYWENSPEKENIGALGGILLDENLEVTHSGGDLPTYEQICAVQKQFLLGHIKWSVCKVFGLQNFVLNYWMKKKTNKNVVHGKIGYITGADLFIRNDKFAHYDEHFFLYYEETDLQNRLVLAGKINFLIEGPLIIHIEKKREKNFPITTFSVVQSQRSALYYVKKNLRRDMRKLKFLTLLDWINPFELKLTKEYIKELKFY